MSNKRHNSSLSFSLPEMHQEVRYKPHESLLPFVDWTPPREDEMPSWREAKRVAIDFECKDPEILKLGPGCRRVGNYVCGVSFAIEDGPEYYLPIRHEGGDNCEWDVWSYIQDQIRDFNGILVGNGIDYDLDWLCQPHGIGGPSTSVDHPVFKKKIQDVQCADVMINELHDKYNLNALCERHGLPGKDETMLRQVAAVYRAHAKGDMWRFPARYVEAYGRIDARRPLQILRRQEPLIESEGVQSIWELEQKVTPIVVKMRRRGIRVDLEKLRYVEEKSEEVEREMLDRVWSETGVRIKVGDVWKAEVLAHALRSAGFDVPKTEQSYNVKTGKTSGGKDSVDKYFLKKCGKVGEWIGRARGWNKLRSTFAAQVRAHGIQHSGDDGFRVHCTFNQLRADKEEDEGGRGVRYGRFSSTDYNIQGQPVRDDEFGELWRSVYVADAGKKWICSDWSQQEPRIGVHYAEKLGLPGAKEFADAYRANPRLDIHQKLADLSGIVRKIVKNYVNGRLYGMGDPKLCRSIDKPLIKKQVRGEWREIPGPEGQEIIDQFDKFAPWVRGLVRAAARQADMVGHVWTILRRKCRFEKRGDKYDKTHKAFSRVGQGGAADQMKATIVQADADGIPVQAAIHDEFDYSESPDNMERARHLKHLQLTVVKFNVPMLVDQEIGPNWGELEKT